jgi:hypothetical protein
LNDTQTNIPVGDERTIRLSDNIVQENVVALVIGTELLDELAGLAQSNRQFDVVIIDCTNSGFFFTADVMIQASEIARTLLEVQGAMVFVKADKAVAVIKESMVGLLTFQIFETLSQLYDYSPSLAHQVQLTLGTKTDIVEESSDLSEQILMSSVPVLTAFGIKLKAGMESTRRRNMVLSAVDNYTPISSIIQKLTGRVAFEELLDELRALEECGGIFPLFAKIPFLVHCFRSKTPFKLKDYLTESRLLTQEQLDSMLTTLQNTQASERLNLGALCVSKGLLTSRQLEIALQDQAFYGQSGDTEKVKILVDGDQASKVQSLVGHLGTTDPAGVLQSLASNRETGVLSVEHKDLQFRALFEMGKINFAKQGKLRGNDAITEFVSVWKEGIFVFIERQPPQDLVEESCKVSRPLDKLLLDSALGCDNIEVVWKKLPRGPETALEKVEDEQGLLSGSVQVLDPQEGYEIPQEELHIMQRLHKEFDGLVSVAQTIKKIGWLTTAKAALAISRLLHYGLVKIPASDLAAPLEKFQLISMSIAHRIGAERSNALLRLSLQASQGYSAKARMFSIGSAGEVGVDLSLARSAGLGLTHVVKQLEEWQVKYIEYVSQELDKSVLREIVMRAHSRS